MSLHTIKEKVIFYWRVKIFHLHSVIGRVRKAMHMPQRVQLPGAPRVLRITDNPLSPIRLSDEYHKIVAIVYTAILERMADPKSCIFHSADNEITKRLKGMSHYPKSTWELPEIKEGLVGSVRLRETQDLRGFQELVALLLPLLENHIYHAPLRVSFATVYRHVPSKLPEFGSILWHSDNHHEEELKCMIYLNEVGVDQAPFEFLRHKDTHETPVIVPSMPRKYPRGRIPPEVIEEFLAQGYESHKMLGPAHSAFLFDEKIIHKGNYAIEGYRDVVVLQLRPTMYTTPPYIGTWTRSF